MNTPLTKAEIRKRLRVTDTKLAELLGVTRSAVSQWPDHEPIPQARWWQLQVLRPRLMRKAA